MDFLVSNPRLKKRKWTAEDLAERVETKKQAITRIKNLHQDSVRNKYRGDQNSKAPERNQINRREMVTT